MLTRILIVLTALVSRRRTSRRGRVLLAFSVGPDFRVLRPFRVLPVSCVRPAFRALACRALAFRALACRVFAFHAFDFRVFAFRTYSAFRPLAVCAVFLLIAAPLRAQSLYLAVGENAVEASAGWSVGPFSDGIETHAAVGIGGRVDVGLAVSRYTYTFDDGFESSFTEYAPFVRYFPIKQQAGSPVSLAARAQVFIDDYGNDDEGRYIQLAATVFRQLKLTDSFAMQPFAGFAFVAESYTFGDGPTEEAQYLTRDFGLHFTTAIENPWILRLTLIEQSFRRETYRAARFAVIRRL